MRMGVLNRYLLRAHTGPFLFALTALTGLLFLNTVALRMESLVGKGLPWSVLGRFAVLSLPSTVALSLPMAVLVAVLYAFSELTEHNEITALAAGGIRPVRVLVPLLVMGAVLTGIMLYFNDAVLPEANHQLKDLLVDIGRKSPTFTLHEGQVNEIHTGNSGVKYYLTARRIDPAANTLQGVAIYDRNNPLRPRTIYAARGTMAFNAARTDLFLTLYDGEVLEPQGDQPGGFQRLYFQRQIIPMRGVGDSLNAQMINTERGDREMDFAALRRNARENAQQEQGVRDLSRSDAIAAVRAALGLAPLDSAHAAAAEAAARGPRVRLGPGREPSTMTVDPLIQGAIVNASTKLSRVNYYQEEADRYRTQLNKMWAIPFACLVFTLIAPPLALRFPRGGVGMVVAASSAIFAIYYVGLISGESLADRRVASPVWSMWISDVVFGVIGLILAVRMGRAGGTVRGGGWEELWIGAREAAARLVRRMRTRSA